MSLGLNTLALLSDMGHLTPLAWRTQYIVTSTMKEHHPMFKRVTLFLLTNLLVISAVTILLSLLGLNQATGLSSLMVICLIWGMVGSFISLALSKFFAKRAMGLQPLDPHGPYGFVAMRVEEYARKANIDTPEVYLYDSGELNAFATGPSRNSSLVAVSRGLVETMSQEEVEGVIGHEVAHIANGDMVTMALVQGVVNAFVMFLSRAVAIAIDSALRGEDDEGEGLGQVAYILLVMVLQAVFGLLTAPVVAWFSRLREFRADEGGAKLAGRAKMVAALRSLQANLDDHPVDDSAPGLKTMKISGGGLIALLSTHPPLEKRIEALSDSNGARVR